MEVPRIMTIIIRSSGSSSSAVANHNRTSPFSRHIFVNETQFGGGSASPAFIFRVGVGIYILSLLHLSTQHMFYSLLMALLLQAVSSLPWCVISLTKEGRNEPPEVCRDVVEITHHFCFHLLASSSSVPVILPQSQRPLKFMYES